MAHSATALVMEGAAELEAERRAGIAADQELAALGQPPAWVWALTEGKTDPQRAASLLMAYTLDVARRAGYLDALKACCIAQAQRDSQRETLHAFGAPTLPTPDAPGPPQPERAARTLVARMVDRETARLNSNPGAL